MNAVELFAGAGGLALATSLAGFRHKAVIEWNKNACETIRENNRRGTINWPLHQCDVRDFDFSSLVGTDLLAGGPPCQPFSIGGKHLGHSDHRNLFPEAVRAVRELQPKAVLLENVKGLTRNAFSKFFEYVLLQINYPELTIRGREDWTTHWSRLERHHTKGRHTGLSYNVVFRKLNAADYGVPQKRERVFIVGFRSDLGVNWSFPDATHSLDGLLHSQWISGDYWDRHRVSSKERGSIPEKFRLRVQRLKSELNWNDLCPWKTVRDAISDLTPQNVKNSSIQNHIFNPGAKVYGGHTGSPVDEPAKTLKAGDHGVPGGENMVSFSNGEVRYFTVRESARLQTFPDEFVFQGSWTETMRQLGNAVAVDVGFLLASSIQKSLQSRTIGRRQYNARESLQSSR